ncbi:MAG: DUF3617 domain-containing protein [Alphaproteobacteria bacterium]
MKIRTAGLLGGAAIVAIALVGGPFERVATAGDEMPPRKPGLWETTTTVDGRQVGGGKMRQCIDAAIESKLREFGRDQEKDCSLREMKREGSGMTLKSVCKMGQSTASTTGKFTGDLTENYRGDLEIKYEPPFAGKSEAKMTIEAKWLGPCEAGQKPGDMMLPGGMKMNMGDMQDPDKMKAAARSLRGSAKGGAGGAPGAPAPPSNP